MATRTLYAVGLTNGGDTTHLLTYDGDTGEFLADIYQTVGVSSSWQGGSLEAGIADGRIYLVDGLANTAPYLFVMEADGTPVINFQLAGKEQPDEGLCITSTNRIFVSGTSTVSQTYGAYVTTIWEYDIAGASVNTWTLPVPNTGVILSIFVIGDTLYYIAQDDLFDSQTGLDRIRCYDLAGDAPLPDFITGITYLAASQYISHFRRNVANSGFICNVTGGTNGYGLINISDGAAVTVGYFTGSSRDVGAERGNRLYGVSSSGLKSFSVAFPTLEDFIDLTNQGMVLAFTASLLVTGPASVNPAWLTVSKVTSPTSGTLFHFTTTGGSFPSTFDLSDGQSRSFSTLVPGTYGITEAPSLSYATSVVVSNADLATAIGLAAGDDVLVTFTNTLNPVPSVADNLWKLYRFDARIRSEERS